MTGDARADADHGGFFGFGVGLFGFFFYPVNYFFCWPGIAILEIVPAQATDKFYILHYRTGESLLILRFYMIKFKINTSGIE